VRTPPVDQQSHVMAMFPQRLYQVPANKSRPTGNKYLHDTPPFHNLSTRPEFLSIRRSTARQNTSSSAQISTRVRARVTAVYSSSRLRMSESLSGKIINTLS